MLKVILYILLVSALLALAQTVLKHPGKPIFTPMELPGNQEAIDKAERKAMFDLENDPLPEYRQEL
jgi:hypothetical protein